MALHQAAQQHCPLALRDIEYRARSGAAAYLVSYLKPNKVSEDTPGYQPKALQLISAACPSPTLKPLAPAQHPFLSRNDGPLDLAHLTQNL
jgi:hypothetical protein